MRQWEELMSSRDFEDVKQIFNPDDVLFPDMPSVWGGLGRELVSQADFRPERAVFLRIVRPKVEFSDLSLEFGNPAVSMSRGVIEVVRAGRENVPEIVVTGPDGVPPLVTGWVTRESARALSVHRFGASDNKFRWSVNATVHFSVYQSWVAAVDEVGRMGSRAKAQLYRDYVEAFHYSHNQCVWVSKVPDEMGILEHAPEGLGLPKAVPTLILPKAWESQEYHVPRAEQRKATYSRYQDSYDPREPIIEFETRTFCIGQPCENPEPVSLYYRTHFDGGRPFEVPTLSPGLFAGFEP